MLQTILFIARKWPLLAGRRRGYRLLDRIVRPLIGRGLIWVRHGGIWQQYDFNNYHERLMAYELQGEEGFACLPLILRPGDTFVDVGANAGMYSAAAANGVGKTGKVFSIEANPALAARLNQSAERNRPVTSNWRIIEAAVTDEDDREIEFYLSAMPAWSSLRRLGENEKPSQIIRVKTRRLDTLAREFGKVRLMKIDIEGSECLALRGGAAWLKSDNAPDYIISECNDPVLRRFGSSAQELISLLRGHGYEPHRMFWKTRMKPAVVPYAAGEWENTNFDLIFIRSGVEEGKTTGNTAVRFLL